MLAELNIKDAEQRQNEEEVKEQEDAVDQRRQTLPVVSFGVSHGSDHGFGVVVDVNIALCCCGDVLPVVVATLQATIKAAA